MIQFSNNLIIKSDLTRVFEFLGTIENFSKWNYAVKRILKEHTDRNKLETHYHLYRDVGQQTFEDIMIREYEHNKKLSLDATGDVFSYTSTYEFTPIPEGTFLINTMTIKPNVSSLMFNLFKSNVKNAVNQNLYVLKDILEAAVI